MHAEIFMLPPPLSPRRAHTLSFEGIPVALESILRTYSGGGRADSEATCTGDETGRKALYKRLYTLGTVGRVSKSYTAQ